MISVTGYTWKNEQCRNGKQDSPKASSGPLSDDLIQSAISTTAHETVTGVRVPVEDWPHSIRDAVKEMLPMSTLAEAEYRAELQYLQFGSRSTVQLLFEHSVIGVNVWSISTRIVLMRSRVFQYLKLL